MLFIYHAEEMVPHLSTPCIAFLLRACLILSVFALVRGVFARLRRPPDGVCCVENALRAFSTQHTHLLRGEAALASERDGN